MDKHQQEKTRRSVLDDPVSLGSAMKRIYESSDVSIRRDDETKVVSQIHKEPTLEQPILPRSSQIPPKSSSTEEKRNSVLLKDVQSQNRDLFDISTQSDSSLFRSYSSRTEMVFWATLIIIFFGIAYWISL